MLALHSLALGVVLTDGKHNSDKGHSLNIQVRPISAVRDAPGSAYDQAKADLQAGNAAQALDGFRRAVRETPQSVDALNGLAVVYDLLGRFDQSRIYYEAALAIAPNSPLVTYNFGYSLYLQHDFAAARPLLTIAARSDDDAAKAAAFHTLQLIVDAPVAVAVAAPVVAKQSWVERTSDGEQRLVLDKVAPVLTAAGDTPAAEIALIAPAVAWTDVDERRVDRAARAEAVAAAAETAVAAASADPVGVVRAAPVAVLPEPAIAAIAPHAMAHAVAVAMRPARVVPSGRLPALAVAEATLDRARAPAPPVPAWHGPEAVVARGYRLLAADTSSDPVRRRRPAPIEVGGMLFAERLEVARQALAADPHSLTLDRLSASLTPIVTAADADGGVMASGLDRLASGLALFAPARG